ncbi:MAG TPA: imidazole glycerol phosphate synthase subunit HisH [Candidatus Saccharimonadales bacterium]|nr:imidazole glycerol phosphate synthase subunit HisH [Candidatus Saccharimonadales bacterium]
MIAIVSYDAGNIGSVSNALRRLGVDSVITSDVAKIKSAKGVIFPGQGRAGPAMKSLANSGLDKLLPKLEQPFLGICLGMQLMVDRIDEDNQTGLGVIPGKCVRFKDIKPIPHMGWNQVKAKTSPLFNGIKNDFYQYFVHSYAVHSPDRYILAETDYGGKFASAIARDNFYGTQFHPEKSGETGEQVLKNFLNICGAIK